MTKKADTWMPLYIGDYLKDTTHLTTEQHGAYLLILMALWGRPGGLPDVNQNLAKTVKLSVQKWRKLRGSLIDGVLLHSDGIVVTQKRLTEERLRASANTEERSKAGRIGAAKRWQTHASDDGKRMIPPIAENGPSPSPKDTTCLSSTPPIVGVEGVTHSLTGFDTPPKRVDAARRAARPPPIEFDGENAQTLNGHAIVKLADTFELPSAWGHDAEALGFNAREVLHEAERFKQYWRNEDKRRTVKNWRRSWSNWLGKAAERKQ